MKMSILHELALKSIEEEFSGSNMIDKELYCEKHEFLKEQKASYVTLWMDNNLRGSAGNLYPDGYLIDEVINNTKKAAFCDYRFQPLKQNETKKINIDVSILSEPKAIIYESINELKEKIIPKTHGVIIKKDYNKACFLPRVWREYNNVDEFLSKLCEHAGLCEKSLSSFPQIEVFKIEN